MSGEWSQNEAFNAYVVSACQAFEQLHFVHSADTNGPVEKLTPVLSAANEPLPRRQRVSLNIEEYPVSHRAFEHLLDEQLGDTLRALAGGIPHVTVVSFDGIGPNASAVVEVYWMPDETKD